MKQIRGRHIRILVLIMSAAVVISGSSFAGAAQDSSQVNLNGNSGGNIVNGGQFTKQGEYIYYVMSSYNDHKIYRMKTDLSEKTRINNDESNSVGVVGEWLYYSNMDDKFRLYKIRIDGTGRTKICDDQYASNISVVGNWIYYSAGPESSIRLYRIKTDGSSRKQLNSSSTDSFYVSGGWIYYGSRGSIYRIRTDGSGKTLIFKGYADYLNVVGDWIYFINFSDNLKICKIRTNGTGKKALFNDRAYRMNVSGDWIYFESSGIICRIKTDGSSYKKLANVYSMIEDLNIIDDHVYYYMNYNGSVYYRMNSDGTDPERLDGLKAQTSPYPDVIEGSPNFFGNTNGNINNRGLAAGQGDIIYYIKNINGSVVVCKEKKDGSGAAMFSITDTDNINVIGDWIYYTDQSMDLYKMKTNGSDKKSVEDYLHISDIHAAGEWIYYTATDPDMYRPDSYPYPNLYRMRNDGTKLQKLAANIGNRHFNLTGDGIYYSNTQKLLYKMNLDGSGKKMVANVNLDSFIVDGGYLYSAGLLNGHVIVKMKLDGTYVQDITNVAVDEFNLSDGWIYFKNNKDDYSLYKVRTDGSEMVKLNNRSTNSINVVDQWIYFESTGKGTHYRIKTDGSNEQKLDS